MQLIRRGVRNIFALITSIFLLSACGGGGGAPATPPVTLNSIAVTPANPNVGVTSTLQLIATGTYSNNTTKDITTSVTWSSGNTTVATVGAATGLVTPAAGALDKQTAVITATSGTGASALTASTTITMTLPLFSVATVADPLAKQQWHLLNTAQNGYADTVGAANTTGLLGTDLNADPVYSTYGYSGRGVTVAVVDTGLEIAHEDLTSNVAPNGSWNFINSTTDPTSTATNGDHGTMVGGLISMSINYLPSTQTQSIEIVSLGGSSANPNSQDVFIFNQSYGMENTTDLPVNPAVELQYASGTTTLRSGKGALYVKSAGNGFIRFGTPSANCTGATSIGISCQNANFDPRHTLPFQIVMAALNAKGLKSSYSTTGSSIWASTPGGEYGYNVAVSGAIPTYPTAFDPAMITADQSGCAAGDSVSTATSSLFNKGGANLAGINNNCNYTNIMNGTSSAAPSMSGVIALILEANPALNWREVKDILAKTAVQVDTANPGVTVALTGGNYVAEQGWITNAAGLKFHNWYGFGAVNAKAAVDMAKTYVSGSLGAFANTGWISSGVLNLPVPDNSVTGASTTLVVPNVGISGIVEAVQIQVTTTNTGAGYTGDLGIELTSPSGTKSILKNIKDGFSGANLAGMVLASNAFYGEPSTGNWTVKVVDGWALGTQSLTNAQIRIYGH
jgi:subtilisin family serine protease/subtilisin-like proprotein convertase family protein